MILSVRGLTVAPGGGRPVLHELSLDLAPGDLVAVTGPSGAGKSTLALAVARLLRPGAVVSGRIVCEGTDLTALSERAMTGVRGARIGIMFQDAASALNPLQRVHDQVAELFRLHRGASRRAARAAAEDRLARVGLTGLGDRYPHQLSGGQRQRVMVAIATALEPALLIADEPTAALDPAARDTVLALLRDAVAARGGALLLITHDAAVAATAGRVLALTGGRLLPAAPAGPARPRQLPAPGAAVVLSGQGLTKTYPRQPRAALAGVSLELHVGETLAITGPSGSGKSTLLRLLTALDAPDAGTVTLGGEAFHGQRALRRRIQLVFQDPDGSLDPAHPVARSLAEPLHLMREVSAPERGQRVVAAMRDVGLDPAMLTRRPRAFSGGERQRLAIARALVVRPDVLALDEPVSALDPAARDGVLDLLARLRATHGMAMLLVTHDPGLAASFAHRRLVLDNGRIA